MTNRLGITNNPVDQERDPGFGADTEQRRVEFAAQLELEAFQLALSDATKLARSNLIKALRLWKQPQVIPNVSALELRDIMVLWKIIELLFLIKVFSDCLTNVQSSELLHASNLFSRFTDSITTTIKTDIPRKIATLSLPIKCIVTTRESFGGDLIFSLRNKTIEGIYEILQKTSNRIAPSQREEFKHIIEGVPLSIEEIMQRLNSPDPFLSILEDIVSQMKEIKEYQKSDSKHLEAFFEVLSAIHRQSSQQILKLFYGSVSQERKDIDDRVKEYYGIK